MRYNINLARRPYIDARSFYANWLAILVPLFVLAAVLVGFAAHAAVSSREVARGVRKVEDEIAQLDQQKKRAEEVMNGPENRDTRQKSQFLNQVIARKAFSWTRAFEELERVVPPRVHVMSIRPEVKNDEMQIVMTVAGDTRENVLELMRRMETSQSFRQPRITSEDVKQTQARPEVEFQVEARYVPQSALPVPVTIPNDSGKGGK
jgi:type IV pilus assembly protein PilN